MGIDGLQDRHKPGRDIIHRWKENPLIEIDDLDFMCSDIHNAGVVFYGGEYLLLITIEHLSGKRCIHLATPHNFHFTVDPTPFLEPSQDPKYKQHESHGVLDARVTFLEGYYYITYIAFGDHGYRLGLAKTKDFESVERVGLIAVLRIVIDPIDR